VAIALGVLDLCPVPAGATAAQAVAASLDLAVAAEHLGYRRWWVAEHHNTPSLASASPEILIAAAAARTSRIRVGSGGVLLSHYSPLKVAETFRLLEALHPGRVDLGLGRTPGTDEAAEGALRYRPGAPGDEAFGERVQDLLGFLDGDLAPGHPYAGVRAVPDGPPGRPDVWILGSSSTGAGGAAALGLPFAFAHFITPRFGPQIVASYRRAFRPSARLAAPRALVAAWVLCADTEAETRRLAASLDVWRLRPEGAERGPLLPPEEAAARPLSPVERARAEQKKREMVIGAPGQVKAGLEALAAAFGVDEILVLTVCHDPAARLRSYLLVAEAMALR
jgi:luciferase family oxidoreductase group 1